VTGVIELPTDDLVPQGEDSDWLTANPSHHHRAHGAHHRPTTDWHSPASAS